MAKEKRKVEVLAPAGSFDSMRAAVCAGADAVYIGGARFGARAYADNLNQENMIEAINYAHLHGVSLYMTVNTLVKERELEELYEYLLPYYESGLDAVIVQDYGVLASVRRWFPDMHVHASTQMTVTGAEGARILKEMGVSRVVTARELSLAEIRRIHDQEDIEIESFVHGALCYCYSGQCLMSSLIGGRSGNRGRCAQPCRLPYDVFKAGKRLNQKDRQYIMSLKDLCTLDILPDILESGVYSLKIEGRMKSPRYTAGVVSVYRKYVDMYLKHGREGYQVDDDDRRMLLELFDRGGQTEGYYHRHNGRDMLILKEKSAFRQADQKLFDYLDKTFVDAEKKEKISGRLTVSEQHPMELSLRLEDREDVCAAVEGAFAQTARNQPVTVERMEKQIRKTGDTPFEFVKLETSVEGNVFIPVQDINELRREGIEQLKKAILLPYRRRASSEFHAASSGNGAREEFHAASAGSGAGEKENRARRWKLHVLVSEEAQFDRALDEPDAAEIQIEADGFDPKKWRRLTETCHKAGKTCVLAMPAIFRAQAKAFFDRRRTELEEAKFDAVLLRALEEAKYLEEFSCRTGTPLYSDCSLYMFNHEAERFLADHGISRMTYPLELNEGELRELSGRLEQETELIVYGEIPVMVTAQCVRKTADVCRRDSAENGIRGTFSQEILELRDRTGKMLPAVCHCAFCYNVIYNPSPLALLGMEASVERIGPSALRLQFLNETPEEMSAVIKAYGDSFLRGRKSGGPAGEYTRGHMKRGVE